MTQFLHWLIQQLPANTAYLATGLALLLRHLRQLRKARGWSAEQAAWTIGVETKTYLDWERGKRVPLGLKRLALIRVFPEVEEQEIGSIGFQVLHRAKLDTILAHLEQSLIEIRDSDQIAPDNLIRTFVTALKQRQE